MIDGGMIVAASGVLLGWVVNIVVQTMRLAIRLQKIDDAIGNQTVQLERLVSHVERQNGRIARLELELAEMRGLSKRSSKALGGNT